MDVLLLFGFLIVGLIAAARIRSARGAMRAWSQC
jgi:hypothetical protein